MLRLKLLAVTLRRGKVTVLSVSNHSLEFALESRYIVMMYNRYWKFFTLAGACGERLNH